MSRPITKRQQTLPGRANKKKCHRRLIIIGGDGNRTKRDKRLVSGTTSSRFKRPSTWFRDDTDQRDAGGGKQISRDDRQKKKKKVPTTGASTLSTSIYN
jgi:hypothetical protein